MIKPALLSHLPLSPAAVVLRESYHGWILHSRIVLCQWLWLPLSSGATSYSRNNIAARSNPPAARSWWSPGVPTLPNGQIRWPPNLHDSPGDELPKVGAVDHLAPPTQHSSLIRRTPSYGNRFPIRAFASDARWAFKFMCLWARDALTKFLPSLESLEFLTAISWCGGIV